MITLPNRDALRSLSPLERFGLDVLVDLSRCAIVEDPTFPAMRHFPKAFTIRDEMYMAKQWSRDKVNVLMRMDDTKLDYTNKKVRPDHDFALAWSKMYGNGRVFYSTLGHTNEAWEDPKVQKMYLEAIKWVLHQTEGSAAPHARPTN